MLWLLELFSPHIYFYPVWFPQSLTDIFHFCHLTSLRTTDPVCLWKKMLSRDGESVQNWWHVCHYGEHIHHRDRRLKRYDTDMHWHAEWLKKPRVFLYQLAGVQRKSICCSFSVLLQGISVHYFFLVLCILLCLCTVSGPTLGILQLANPQRMQSIPCAKISLAQHVKNPICLFGWATLRQVRRDRKGDLSRKSSCLMITRPIKVL